MRPLLLTLIANSILGIVVAENCPGVCPEGATLLDPKQVISLPGVKVTFCGSVNTQLKNIDCNSTPSEVTSAQLCTECSIRAAEARNAGCACSTAAPAVTSTAPVGVPTVAPVAPTQAPIAPSQAPVAPTQAPVAPSQAPVAPSQAPVGPVPTDPPVGAPTAAPVLPPTQAPAPAPTETPSTSPSREALNGLGDKCPGICITDGYTLANPGEVVSLPGAGAQFCGMLDKESEKIKNDPELCLEKSLIATSNGCDCVPPPTDMPSAVPTVSQVPTITSAPTVNESFCNGVCASEDERLFNPTEIVIIRDPVTNKVSKAQMCGNLDNEYKKVFGSQNTCNSLASEAQNSGCKCAVPVDCSGMCPTSGEIVVNPNRIVTVDGEQGTCGGFDTTWDAIEDPDVCSEIPAKVEAAITDGCKCAVPVQCSGMCSDKGDEVTTPDLVVALSDGSVATCAQLDSKFAAFLDPDRCDQVPSLIEEAFAAGCKCGKPIECPGLCPNESITTPNEEVTLPDGTVGSCTELDEELKAVIDSEVCVSRLDEILAAGCKCGTPVECAGICLNPNNDKLFEDFREVTNPSTGEKQTCGEIEKDLQDNVIDKEICEERAFAAVKAGCQCGFSTKSPSSSPTFVTQAPSASPTFNSVRETLSPTTPQPPSTPTAPTFGNPTSPSDSGGYTIATTSSTFVSSALVALVGALTLLW